MNKPCLYKQNPFASSLPLLWMLLPQAIPQTEQEKKLPPSSAPVLLVGVSTSLFRAEEAQMPGVFGSWSRYVVPAPPCCERSPGEPHEKQLPRTLPGEVRASGLPDTLLPLVHNGSTFVLTELG